MKKTYYFLMIFIGLTIVGCQPMDDLQDQINADLDSQLAVGDINYTLTEDNYKTDLGLDFASFNSLEDAKQLIPVYLKDTYPTYGAGSSANITFAVYDPFNTEDYTATADDYTAAGATDGYITSTSQIQKLLKNKFESAREGDYVNLTYKTIADEIAYTFSDDDFASLGTSSLATEYPKPVSSAANYGNFDRRDGNDAYWSNDMILEAINVVLSNQFSGVEGQKYNVSYPVYNGAAVTESMTVLFNGNNYVAVDAGMAYELSASDYELAGTELADKYPKPAANAKQFHSFAIVSGDNYWSPEMLNEAFTIILNNVNSDAADGSKYQLTYTVYNGSGTEPKLASLIKKDGAYVTNDNASVSTISVTETYAFTNGSWNMPLKLQPADYTEIGESHPNFSSNDDAFKNIGIFLTQHYPYADEGDVMAVSYDLYSGSVSTEYANFVFENGEWNVIPSVKEQSLKFGFNDGVWVPDNTIRYTVTGDDFAFIGEALADKYPEAAAAVIRYPDFDRRAGNAAYWNDDMILEAMNILLDQQVAPNAAEGQKYVITYAIYNGSNTTETISLIKTGGEWVVNNQ